MPRAEITIPMFTDNKFLFDFLTRSRYTTERRLIVDISASREAYKENELETWPSSIQKRIM